MTTPFELPTTVRDGDTSLAVPVQYAASVPCELCGEQTLTGAQVTDPWNGEQPVCRVCAIHDDRLMPWQMLADAIQAMDQAFVAAGGRENRQWFADHLAGDVGYMATWRWPDDEPVEPNVS